MFLPFSLMICIFDLILVNGLMILISLNIMISDCLVDVVELLPLPNLTFLSPYNLTSLLNKRVEILDGWVCDACCCCIGCGL